MREPYHSLNRRPFPTTPDLSCYYAAQTHECALASLRQGLADGEAILMLSGPPGSGKTLLGHALLDYLEEGSSSAFLTHGCFPNRAGLLQAILYDLGLPHEGKAEHELRLALTDHVLKSYAQGKKTLLLIDEAHLLTLEALEELRLLVNLEGRGGRATQCVLIGPPELKQLLGRPELTSLRQRIGVRTLLAPLPPAEAVEYLRHHIRLAGGFPEQLLTDECVELLARATQGIPRLLNQAGHLTLSLAETAGVEADVEVALEALSVLGLSEQERPSEEVRLEPAVELEVPQVGIEPTVVSEASEIDGATPRLFVAPSQVG